MLIKVKSIDGHLALSEKAKQCIISSGWKYYEDGHSQIYAMIVTDEHVDVKVVEDIVKPSIVFECLL